MKANLIASILLSTLLYTNLLSTLFIMPLVLAGRYDTGRTTVNRDARLWERSLDAPAKVGPYRDLRQPQSDSPVSRPATKQVPIDNSVPDAAMIKSGRTRAKTIKL